MAAGGRTGVTAIVTGILFQQFKSALDAWWLMAGIFGGGVLGLFLLGLISRRAGNLSGLIGVICGVLTITWMTISLKLTDLIGWLRKSMTISDDFVASLEKVRSPFHDLLIPVVGTGVILVGGLLVSRFERPPPVASLESVGEHA